MHRVIAVFTRLHLQCNGNDSDATVSVAQMENFHNEILGSEVLTLNSKYHFYKFENYKFSIHHFLFKRKLKCCEISVSTNDSSQKLLHLTKIQSNSS